MKPSAYYRTFYQNNHLNFILSFLLFSLMSLEGPIGSVLLGQVLDIVAAADLIALQHLLLMTTLFLLAILVIDLAGHRFRARFIHKGLTQYKNFAFQQLSEKSISAFTRESTGRYLSVLTNDVSSIEENYLNTFIQLPYQCVSLLLAFLLMFYYSRLMTLISIVLCLLPTIVTILFGNGLTVRERQVSDQNEIFTGRIKDLLSGFSVLKSFKAEEQARKLFAADNQILEKTKENRRWYRGILITAASVSGSTMQFYVFLISAWLAIRGDISIGTVMIFLNLCNSITNPVQAIPEYLANRKAAKELIRKLADLAEENAGRTGDPISPVLSGAIRLQNVTFGYEKDKPVLQGLSCQFEAGKSYAIVGASGSGKTTLLNLLMGAFDGYTGSLSIDGKELREIDTDSLYELISQVGQNVFIFDDTIRQNITMFRPFPADQVQCAIERAGLAPVIASRGEEYRCGENGVNLSGGERQRISIARSLLRGSNVLLVDEATSALDAMTASHVSGSILDLEGLTRIVITHRLEAALLSRYDKILVLKNGKICEEGSFNELMARKEQFYALYTVNNN